MTAILLQSINQNYKKQKKIATWILFGGLFQAGLHDWEADTPQVCGTQQHCNNIRSSLVLEEAWLFNESTKVQTFRM